MRVVDLELQALGDGGREQIGCRDTDERNEVDTVLVAVDPASGCLERQSRLADTARPDECQQAAVGLVEHAIDRGKLVGSPHERGARSRKVPDPRFERLQRRELGGEPVDLELEDALRDTQVLEAVRAEVAHVGVHERPRGLRQEHLPSVTDGRDPGSLVDGEADVPLVGEPGLARVEPHPHPDRAARKRQLRSSSRSHRIRCTAKRDKEGVALGVHLGAVVRGKRLPEQSPVLVERVGVRVPQLVQKLRRPLDVREEKRDDAGRKRGRHATMITGRDPRVYSACGCRGIHDSTTTALLENTWTARTCNEPDQPCDKALAWASVRECHPNGAVILRAWVDAARATRRGLTRKEPVFERHG